MTNEHYLYVSYFVAAGIGVAAAGAVAAVLLHGHRQMLTDSRAGRLGQLLRRAFPAWLVLAVLLGFMSVTYFDCGHGSYGQIVGDRAYLVHKTQEQTAAMARHLAVAIMAYALVLTLYLWSRQRGRRAPSRGS